MLSASHSYAVIPAKAGIQGCKSVLVALDPGFRRGDGRKKGRANPIVMALPRRGARGKYAVGKVSS